MSDYTDKLLTQEPEALEKIGRIAAKIAYYNFDWRYVTLVMFNTFQYTLALESFLANYKQSVVVKFGKFIPSRRNLVPQYIIFGEDSSAIISTIRWLDKLQYDNSGKYIFICTSPNYKSCNETQIFIALAKVLIVNVVYLRIHNRNEYISFSYDIVLPDKCINSNTYTLDTRDKCAYDDCFKELYPEKLKNFNKCPLVISTFQQPPFMYLNNDTMEPSGGEGDIIKLVANALNATLVIKTPIDGNDFGQYINNNWTGSLGDVFNDRVHLSMCALPVSASKYGHFQISFIYNSMDIVWTAELPPIMPAWQKLLNPFQMDLRIALFFVFVGVVMVNALTKSKMWTNCRRDHNVSPIKSNLLFYSWSLFLGIPILKMPSKSSFLLIVYSWVWFSFIVKTAYQAALTSSLKRQVYEDLFTDFDSVMKRRYPYGGIGSLREYYIDDQYIYKNWISLDFDNITNTLDEISKGNTNFVLAVSKEIVIDHLIKHNGFRHLQILPEKIVNSPTVMYFKKHSVLVQPINRILSFCVESGFTQRTYITYLRQRKYLSQRLSEHDNGPLTYNNFQACMILMVFGWSLSIIFFLTEAYCGRVKTD